MSTFLAGALGELRCGARAAGDTDRPVAARTGRAHRSAARARRHEACTGRRRHGPPDISTMPSAMDAGVPSRAVHLADSPEKFST
ncbi:hypothetical protein ACWC10_35695, partial [Streptomyces sp. NPDC001595]